MMISPPGASDPFAAAAALDRRPQPPGSDVADTASDSAPDASPDVVVTFSRGSPSTSTYDASGRLSGAPTLDDLGANAPDSLTHASESIADGAPAPPADADADADADGAQAGVGQDAAVAA
jgi:hypothetical protein